MALKRVESEIRINVSTADRPEAGFTRKLVKRLIALKVVGIVEWLDYPTLV